MTQLQPLLFLFFLSLFFTVDVAVAQNDSISSMPTVWRKIESYTPAKIALPDNFDSTQEHTLFIGLYEYDSRSGSFWGLSIPFTDAGFIFAAPEAAYPVLLNNGKLVNESFLVNGSGMKLLPKSV